MHSEEPPAVDPTSQTAATPEGPETREPPESSRPPEEPLHWKWVGAGVILGALFIGLFVYLVDPQLERPAVAGSVAVLSIVLVGILIGYRSEGETIREAAVAGLILLVFLAILAVGFLGVSVPPLAWLTGPFFVAGLAMLGGWVGEMLQGTLEEAHEDRAVDWPWVIVSVIIGVTLSAYAVFLGRALFGFTEVQSLAVFAASFFVTGWIVGFFSPGITMVEPAIAAGMMIIVDAGFIILWFDELAPFQTLAIGFGGGMALALLGGWLGEVSQRRREGRRAAA